MPADFERCVKNGGKVRTKSLSEGRYMRLCFLNGKSYSGEIKKSKSSEKYKFGKKRKVLYRD